MLRDKIHNSIFINDVQVAGSAEYVNQSPLNAFYSKEGKLMNVVHHSQKQAENQ